MTPPSPSTGTLDRLREAARRSFGHRSLLPGQEEAMGALLEGRDVLLVSPTGSGKSLSYQLPGVLIDGVTIVISPLLALQRDQIANLGEERPELRAGRISSAESDSEKEAVLAQAASGELEFLFCSPEQLANDEVRERLAAVRPSLVAVDEAHCVSSWGHDFRPDYLRLGDLIADLGDPPIIAMTATAALPVREDIVERLRLADHELVVTGFARDNLELAVTRVEEKSDQQRVVVEAVAAEEGVGIVYCRTRKKAEEYAEALAELGRRTAVYHAGLPQRQREETHEAFLDDNLDVIVATSAFGMGIDKPDIRFVVHAQVPESPDTYYQEIGRAGRDDEPARALLVYRAKDLALGKFFSGGLPDPDEVAKVARVAAKLERDGDRLPTVRQKTGLGPRKAARLLNLLDLVAEAGGPTGSGRKVVEAVTERAEAQRRLQQSRVDMMQGYAETVRCRAEYLLAYFGEEADGLCGHCDNCRQGIAEEPAATPTDAPYGLESRVRHDEFGEGVVTDVEEDRVTVLFDDGYRTLSLQVVEDEGLLEAL